MVAVAMRDERATPALASGSASTADMTVPAVAVRDLWFGYAGKEAVLRGVSLDAAAGEITMVLGASGGGKTTLLKLIKGMLAPRQGRIVVHGEPSPRVSRTGRLDRTVAYIPQQLGLVRSMSVLDNVLTGALGRVGTLASLVRLFPKNDVQRAHELLRMLGISEKAHERVYALSGGERQRVAIARALMQEPRLILADEFVSQLDPVTGREIMELLRGLVRAGITLLMTTHELDLVLRFADRVVVLRDGEKVLDAPAAGLDADALAVTIKR